jgi:hypothetical protein
VKRFIADRLISETCLDLTCVLKAPCSQQDGTYFNSPTMEPILNRPALQVAARLVACHGT